jgi:hypothetical protein
MRKASLQKGLLHHGIHPLTFTVESCLPISTAAATPSQSSFDSAVSKGTNSNLIANSSANTGGSSANSTSANDNWVFVISVRNEERQSWRFHKTYNELRFAHYSFNDLKAKTTGGRITFPTYQNKVCSLENFKLPRMECV